MMYWKDKGFWDVPQEGGIPLEDEYYKKLMKGQEEGFEIVEDSNGYPVLRRPKKSIEARIGRKKLKLSEYDYKSIKMAEAVIEFLLEKFPELEERLPYDISEVMGLKQPIRDEINHLEERLARGDKYYTDEDGYTD